MKIELGKFARSGIETELGGEPAVGVRAALDHYTRRLKSKWTPLPPPRFRAERASGDAAEAFECAIEPDTEAALLGEARRLEMPLDEILAHAVLTYLADLDSASKADEASTPTVPGDEGRLPVAIVL